MSVSRSLSVFWGFLLVAIAGLPAVAQAMPSTGAVVYLEHRATSTEIAQLERRFGIDLVANSAFSTDGRLWRFAYDGQRLKSLLERLEATALVAHAEPDYVYKALGFPNDPLYSRQWNLRAIGMERAWKEADGEGAVVAVIDTGVAANLEDFERTDFVRGYDFVNDDDDATDDQGHGSHVAGTIAQSTDNGRGVAGIAYRARIMPVKVLDGQGYGTLADVAEGIKLAADRGANVINLSLGGGADSFVLREAVDYATRKGATVVCAAGNEDSPSAIYPAAYGNCLSVSAFGPEGKRSFYSNYGRGVDIAAPGGDKTNGPEGGILQNTIDANGDSVYASYQGTSMAAPHVAGVAALLWSKGVHDPSLIRKAMLGSARTATDDTRNAFGAGRLDANQALEILDQPYVYLRGGFSWMVPLATLVTGSLLGLLVLRLGGGAEPINDSFYALGFVLMGLGIFPLQALGTLWGPEGWLALLSTPLPQWDQHCFEGMLNPVLHSVLVPGLLALFLGSNAWGRSFAIGACIGTAALLVLQGTFFYAPLMWFEQEDYARYFLLGNAAACALLGFFTHKFGRSAVR